MAEDGLGWIESVDPATGRTFYANRYTRTTQWDPPPGWKTTAPAPSSSRGDRAKGRAGSIGGDEDDVLSGIGRSRRRAREEEGGRARRQSDGGDRRGLNTNGAAHRRDRQPDAEGTLPDGWEEMTDPSTGRKFYIDHATKTTTWERPAGRGVDGGGGNGLSGRAVLGLNQHGSHSRWDDDPRVGSRVGSGKRGPRDGREEDAPYRRQHSYRGDMDASGASSHPGPPPLDFAVVSVPDALRAECPGCGSAFTYTRRRHHCRLCGDVFCDACSSSRTVLPLDGPEFDTPVRVCDECMEDVKRGNYFSLRRYLTPLQLYDPNDSGGRTKRGTDDGAGSGEATREITSDTVAASLSSLSADIDAMVLEPTTFGEKMTMPASVLVPAVGKHLGERSTAEYAIRVLASLLMLGSVVGDDSFALAAIGVQDPDSLRDSESTGSMPSLSPLEKSGLGRPRGVLADDLGVLEWNGTDSRSLSALEQAVKVVYYVTDPDFIARAISRRDRSGSTGSDREQGEDGDEPEADGSEDADAAAEEIVQIDIHRAFRSMLDHTTCSRSPSLQRWAAATLRHLISEDRRRASLPASASGGASGYQSFITQLVSTGGIMILCSLLSSDDAETRAHATSTLEAIVTSMRDITLARDRRPTRAGRGTGEDSAIVDAVVAGGGCGRNLAHLLISADDSVAMSGCSFASSLISPLLTDPRGSGGSLQRQVGGPRVGGADDDGLSSYRKAALALVVGEGSNPGDVSCLPSLIQILRGGAEDRTSSWGGEGSPRSIELQLAAGECVAAVGLAIAHIAGGVPFTDDAAHDPQLARAKKALDIMERERLVDVAYHLATSASSRSLDPSRDTPRTRLREAAGLMLFALASCSNRSSSYLETNKAVSALLGIASESIGAPSALRGAWASRGLCHLETSALLLLRAWGRDGDDDVGGDGGSRLGILLDALDANAVGVMSQVVKERVHLKHHDQAFSQMRVKMAVCYMLAAMFGIAGCDNGGAMLGASRLYGAVDADCAAALAYSNGDASGVRSDLVASTVFLLGATLPYAQKYANEDKDEPLPMMELSEACLLAVGSICGSAGNPRCFDSSLVAKFSNSGEAGQDKYYHMRQDASTMACKALTAAKDRGPLLPSVLIGALGESLVIPALRLTLAIAHNGHQDVHAQLARSGMLVPVCDILQQSLSSGDRRTFLVAVAIVRFCGPCTNVERSNGGSIPSLQNAIRILSCVLESEGDHVNGHKRKALLCLKFESLLTLESLSSNETLHSTMITDAFPSLTDFLIQLDGRDGDAHDGDATAEIDVDGMICSALRTIQSIISLPSAASLAAAHGIIPSLVKIMNQCHNDSGANKTKQEISLGLLHAISLGKNGAVNGGNLLSDGVMESVAALIGGGGISAKVTSLSLDIIDFILTCIVSDLDQAKCSSTKSLSNNSIMQEFIDGISCHEQFIRALIATMVAINSDNNGVTLYGAPLPLLGDTPAASYLAEGKVIKILFRISSLLCSPDSGEGKGIFSRAFMLKDIRGSAETVALACCMFLDILMDEVKGICVPHDRSEKSIFLQTKLPIVRNYLLEGLNSSLDDCMSGDGSQDQAQKYIRDFKIPQICLLSCQSETVSQAAFDLYENIILPLPYDVIGDLLLADKSSLVALFDLVTGQKNLVHDFDHSKQTFAQTLGGLAKAGLLSEAVERFGLRNNAIAALSAAMQGSEDGIIDESDDSMSRICVESLAAILGHGKDDYLEITSLEARTMARAIGKILSSTVLGRFFTQASLEETFDDSVDHSLDRSAISRSAEARLLCSIASFPETLEMLGKTGGLEAIGLIAHEGELAAIRAIKKACESSPESVMKVDAHLSIMDALIQVESKPPTDTLDFSMLREVAIECINIITHLSQNRQTSCALMSAEQSFGCLEAAMFIISASSASQKCLGSKEFSLVSLGTKNQKLTGKGSTLESKHCVAAQTSEDLNIGDKILVDSTNLTPPRARKTETAKLQGIVAHLGPVCFAPGDDWVGVRLTGSSAGLGKNDGSVKGVKYFDVGSEGGKDGMFVKKSTVKKQTNKGGIKDKEEADNQEDTDIQDDIDDTGVEENTLLPARSHREQIWARLLVKGDLTLEKTAFSLLLSFSSSKPHRVLLMESESLIGGMTDIIELQKPSLIDFQCKALDLIVSFTLHLHKSDSKLTELFCSVVESRMQVIQISRVKRDQAGAKRLLASAVSGIQNIFCYFMNTDEQMRSLKICVDLFVFLADSLYKGPKSRRLAAPMEDGVLFFHLLSFFVLSQGSNHLLPSIGFTSSLIRLTMMTAGEPSLACHIPVPAGKGEGGNYWDAALSFCLICLSFTMTESSQDKLGTSYMSLISEPKSFHFCCMHIAENKFGAASLMAKQILARLDKFTVDD